MMLNTGALLADPKPWNAQKGHEAALVQIQELISSHSKH